MTLLTKPSPTLEDIVGLEYTKLGFFGEVKKKMAQLQAINHALERKQRKLEAIIDGISDVMAIISTNFTIISVNRLFFNFFGPDQPKGNFCHNVFRKQNTPCSDCPVIIARETNTVRRETRIFDIDDRRHHFEVTVSPLRDSKNRPLMFLLLMRDVTEANEYQTKYNNAQKMAAVGALAAGVAHEINNPLTSISGFTEGLKRRLPLLEKSLIGPCGTTPIGNKDASPLEEVPTDTDVIKSRRELLEDFTEYIDTILSECNRCRDIVQGLLTFSPRKKIDFTALNLKRLVTDVLNLLRYRFKQNPGVTITLNARKDLPPVMGNAAELKQVILNLICNALDAVNEQGDIRIFLSPKVNDIALVVQDNGSGISPENLELLFDPFFTTKPIGQGMGIGLSTCYNIIQQHHGEITVESQKDMGTTFTILLPHRYPNPKPAPSPPDGHGERRHAKH